MIPRPLRLILAVWLAVTPAALKAEPAGVATVGHARFTAITPTVIRLEYSPTGNFVDLPSWFAVNRVARDPDAKITLGEKGVEIDTGKIYLTYVDDGKPFSPENLHATINDGSKEIEWKPGLPSHGNLGGTLTTLDGIKGPVPLGNGLLSRDGWHLQDDSRSALFSGDWIAPRPDHNGQDWYLFGYGSDYRAAFRSFTAISGPVPLPRKYTLGVWYSRYWSYTADDFKRIVEEYETHGYPLDVLVMDMDWHVVKTDLPNIGHGYANLVWTGYTWNKELIPDPPELLRWMHDRGIAVTLNDHPADGIQPHEEMYPEFMRAMGGDPATQKTIPFDAGDKRYLDTFYAFSHAPRERDGVDFWWLDWQQGRRISSLSNVTSLQVLNFYNYTRSAQNGLRGQSFSRWGGWGDHRYPIHFSGDTFTNWETLAFEVPFTSTAGNVGCFFWSHDIGGHQGGRNEESYARWCQFGAFTGALRSHSTRNAEMDRRPWTYSPWAENSMRRSYRLRSEMMPYLYTSIWQATRDSVPYLRPLYIDHPDMAEAYQNGQEYTFGDNLLVAPIAQAGTGEQRVATQTVWFPAGDWYDFFSGERFVGPSKTVAADSIDTFPLYVRGGVPLPMQGYTPHPGTAPLTDLVLRCYPGRNDQSASSLVYEDDGLTDGYKKGECATTALSYSRHGDDVTITVAPAQGNFHGQPDKRRYVVELPGTQPLVSCSATMASTAYDKETLTNRIELPETPVNEGWSMTVRVADAD